MGFPCRRAAIFAAVSVFASALLFAEDWQTAASLPGVNLTGLTAKQKADALKILREQGCTCGCSMKMAQCRVEDPSCAYSTGLSEIVVKAVKEGKTPEQAIQAASASRFASRPQNKVLDEPVKLPVAGAPVTGPADAPVTLVEFSDFQCPYCVQATPEIEALLHAYPKQVKLIFKQFPLEIHSDAYRAAAASLAAHKQGKFWEMHYALFQHHQDLSMAAILEIAKDLKLDEVKLQKDMASKELVDTVAKDLQDGTDAGVEGTPTLFINGQRYNGRIQLGYLRQLIDAELKKAPMAKQQTAQR